MALLKYLHVGKAGESIEWASETMCTVVDVDAIPGGIQSEPPDGYLEVTNVYSTVLHYKDSCGICSARYRDYYGSGC